MFIVALNNYWATPFDLYNAYIFSINRFHALMQAAQPHLQGRNRRVAGLADYIRFVNRKNNVD